MSLRGNSAPCGAAVAGGGTAGGSAAPVESLPPSAQLHRPAAAHLELGPPERLLKLRHTFSIFPGRKQQFMDKLKRVLSGQDDGNSDGTGILEVSGS